MRRETPGRQRHEEAEKDRDERILELLELELDLLQQILDRLTPPTYYPTIGITVTP